MKIILTTCFLFSIFACNKVNYQSATVIKDCTGTYLRMNGKDYQVCNLETTNSIPDGKSVQVDFKKITACNGSAKDAITCMMYHQNEGWIEVEKIK